MPLPPERYFSPEPNQRAAALELYSTVAGLPLICPHGHVDPRLFVDPEARFGNPVELLILPDHYVLADALFAGRQPGKPGRAAAGRQSPTSRSRRTRAASGRRFAEHFYLFQGTPSGMWLRDELAGVFGIDDRLTAANADEIYDRIAEQLAAPEFSPRRLYERFNIEVLCTTDAATDRLEAHAAIRASGWAGRIRPTFRPDAVLDLAAPGWRQVIDALSDASGRPFTTTHLTWLRLENRRAFFKSMGATATDHASHTADTIVLSSARRRARFSSGPCAAKPAPATQPNSWATCWWRWRA